MKLGLLLLLILGLFQMAGAQASAHLEISEYRLPKVERIVEDSVVGFLEPGCLEFEMYVGIPTRELFGQGHDSRNPVVIDTLTKMASYIKGERLRPPEDIDGNVWTMSHERIETRCPIYTVARNDIPIYHFRDCIETEDPDLYVRAHDWWMVTWSFKPVADTSFNHENSRGFQVIVNGELLSDKYGYAETWDYHYVGDKPFFLFRRDSTFGWNYDGTETISRFDDFYHGHCCEPACSDPLFRTNEFSFYARRDSIWYLVYGHIVE